MLPQFLLLHSRVSSPAVRSFSSRFLYGETHSSSFSQETEAALGPFGIRNNEKTGNIAKTQRLWDLGK